MTSFSPARPAADRNLLFAVLALQMDFVSRDSLIQAMNAWVLEKSKPLGQILVENGCLSGELQTVLDSLVDKHLELHGGDAQQSLASVRRLGPLPVEVSQISDPEVQASLAGFNTEFPSTVAVSSPAAAPRSMRAESAAAGPEGSPATSAGRFRILRHHAGGGLGDVFVAQDEELQREVALKEIKRDWANHPPSRARFLMEATITGGLEHPGIVPVYALGDYPDGRPYYAMRFIRGDSLQEALQQFHESEGEQRNRGERTLELRKLLDRFVDLCNAVAYAHSRGVIHRDLKPANVMLGPYGETLVVDWGLAKTIGRSEEAHEIAETTLRPDVVSGSAPTHGPLGTPAYMSPEQAAGHLDQLSPASDVYSLGATLYHLLTGKRPIEGAALTTMLDKIQRGDFPPPRQVKETVPAALEAVCLKAMALWPEDRYPSARVLADEIERWLADEPVSAHEDSYVERAARWMRRHRSATLAGGTTLLLVALVSLLAGLLINRERLQAQSERDKALTAEGEARAAEQDAQELRQLATSRFQLAVENTTRVKDLAEAPDSNLGTANASVLERVLSVNGDNLDALVEDAEDEAQADALQMEVARNLIALAKLRVVIGDSSGSVGAAERAVELLEVLSAKNPDELPWQASLADALDDLAYATAIRGNTSASLAHYQRGLTIRQQLVERDPLTLDRQADVAKSHYSVGLVLTIQGHLKAALSAFQRAEAIRTRLVAALPENREWRSGLAWSRVRIASTAQQLSEESDTLARYQEAIGVHEQLSLEEPNNVRWKQYLADLHLDLGHELHSVGRADEAAAQFHAVRDLAVPQSLADPRHTEWMRLRIGSEVGLFDIDDPANRLSAEQQLEVLRGFVATCQQRTQEDPGDTLWKSRLGFVNRMYGLAILRHAVDDEDRREAETALRTAVEIATDLAAQDPENYGWSIGLGLDHEALRQFYIATGQEELAEREDRAAREPAVRFCERRAKDDPDSPYWRGELARALQLQAGTLARDSESVPEAIEKLLDAIALLQPQVEADPENTRDRSTLAAAHWYAGAFLAAQEKFEEASTHSRAALEQYQELERIDPSGPTRLSDLAQTYDHLEFHLRMAGRPEEAKEALAGWRAVRARVYALRLQQAIEPTWDNPRRQLALMRRQYYEEQLAGERINLERTISLYWADQTTQRLTAVAEMMIDLAATTASAWQWSQKTDDDRLAIDPAEVGRLLQTALGLYEKAYEDGRTEAEAALIAQLEDAVRSANERTEAEESRRQQTARVAQGLAPTRDLLTQLQQEAPLSESLRGLADAIDAIAAQVGPTQPDEHHFVLLAEGSAHTAGARVIAASRDGGRLATASSDNTVRIRDAKTAETVATLEGSESAVVCLDFSADGQQLAAGTDDGHVIIWDLQQLEPTVKTRLYDVRVNSVSFSADRRYLAVTRQGAGQPGIVRLWDVTASQELSPIEGLEKPVYVAMFLDSSPELLLTVGVADNSSLAEVRIVDCDKREVTSEQQLDLRQQPLFLAPSSNGSMLAVSYINLPVTLWDVASGEPRHEFPVSDASPVLWLNFSPGNDRLVSGNLTGNVNVWHSDSGELLGRTVAGLGSACAVFVGDENTLATARGDVLPLDQPEELKIWRLPAADHPQR